MWEEIKPKLEALPPYHQGASLSTPPKSASMDGQSPSSKNGRPQAPKPMKVASTGYRPKAVDLDFISIVTGTTYTFASGQTYFLSSAATFTGTVNFYGSCVI